MPHRSSNSLRPLLDPTGSRLSIRDFLTDGSIAGLCAEITALTGVPVWLRDVGGEAILPGPTANTWDIVSEREGARRASRAAGAAVPAGQPPYLCPIEISTGPIGWIAALLPDETDAGTKGAQPDVRNAIELLASSVRDVCEAQLSLHHRIRELDALYRLSALLVQTDRIRALLDAALGLAIEVLHADGGMISEIRPGDRVPTIRAQRGFPEALLETESPLYAPGSACADALDGATVVCDLDDGAHERVPVLSGFRSLVCTPVVYLGTLLGTLTLVSTRPRRFTSEERELLRSIADHVATAVNDARARKLHAENQRIKQQVRLAADVQRRMLPRQLPTLPGLDLAARYEPSFELGGDFYDLMELGGHLGIAVGDVVGKGVPAGLLMSAVRASLRAHTENVYELSEVLSRVNRALEADTLDNEFATLWYGVINPDTLQLTHVSAGHERALVLRTVDGGGVQIHEVGAPGMVLGVDPSQVYRPEVFQLREGDVVVVYTDGLTDATDFESRRFGKTRVIEVLARVLREDPQATASGVIEQLFWHLRQFVGLSRRADDVTVTVVRVNSGGRA